MDRWGCTSRDSFIDVHRSFRASTETRKHAVSIACHDGTKLPPFDSEEARFYPPGHDGKDTKRSLDSLNVDQCCHARHRSLFTRIIMVR
jgi:hypothetical protein